MVEDVYNPAERFRTEFRERFRKVAEETFDELVKISGIDVQENRVTVNKIRNSEQTVAELNGCLSWAKFWRGFLWLLAIAAVGVGIYFMEIPQYAAICVLALVLLLVLLFGVVHPKIKRLRAEIEEEESDLQENKRLAWEQMQPLNRLFDWDVTVRMITKTVPKIQFDPFFTTGRLRELYRQFGWNDEYNRDKSVLFAHSGEINGNPFILGRTLYMQWGEKTYYGSRKVSYMVRSGNSSYRRTETLNASVTKPYPEYYTDTFLLYGCDAAPNLVFHRTCSGLANDEHSFWGKRSKNAERKKLEKFSRKLDDDSQYTIMANRDFETLFNTMDRNNEVEFRLLFTPVAQMQMLEILRDNNCGFGDDFNFNKVCKLNVIEAKHLNELDLDCNPDRYKSYCLEDSRSEFMVFNQRYFRALYYAFAPLLAVPLYQQTRTHENIYGIKENRRSCFWEQEALANFYGDSHFAHPKCATRSILKTSENRFDGDRAEIEVTAHGYKAVQRVDTVQVKAGNGRYYNVDVAWDDYIPVSRKGYMRVAEDDEGFQKKEMDAQERADYIFRKESSVGGSIYRRSILSRIVK